MNDVDIRYELDFSSPQTHTIKITCTIQNLDQDSLLFSLPTWTPGSYLIRDFAQHINQMSTSKGTLTKIDKTTWSCETVEPSVTIHYDVYAFDPSVRAAFFDDTYVFMTGTSVFIRLHGLELTPHKVTLKRTPFQGRVNTSLTPSELDTDGFGSYQSPNYHDLIDHPILIGEVNHQTFETSGVQHEIVVFPKISFDDQRLAADCQKICKEHIDLFGAPAPFSRYLFILRAEEIAYGGLEHSSSSALVCKVSDLPLKHQTQPTEGYRGLLGLFSHEYFHAWNIKRLKPEPFFRFDYNSENYTDLLWFFEGFTSYYDDLALARSRVIDEKSYLELLSKAITRVYSENGRLKQSLSHSSFDAWIKFYKPNENSPNANVSYYLKGSLAALVLDLTIRLETGNQKSLDDVMRSLWNHYAQQHRGVSDAIIRQTVAQVVGQNLDRFFDRFINTCDDLPLEEVLASCGVEVSWKSPQANSTSAYLGCTLKDDGENTIATVTANSPAENAGLCPGDKLLSFNNWRVAPSKLEVELTRFSPNENVTVHFFRRGWLRETKVVLSANPRTKCELRFAEKAGAAQLLARNAWFRLE